MISLFKTLFIIKLVYELYMSLSRRTVYK